MFKKLQEGFTLIELLIAIGIIGIMASVVLVGIDPLDKINAANDSKVQRDINAIANAMESYAATHDGTYAANQSPTLTNSGDLKVVINPPTGYNPYTVSGGVSGTVTGQLKSKKYTVGPPVVPAFVWCSTSGRAGATADTATCP